MLAYALAGFAALVGLVGVGSGFYGLYTLDSLERLMTMGHAFEGNVSATEWRAGYENAIEIETLRVYSADQCDMVPGTIIDICS